MVKFKNFSYAFILRFFLQGILFYKIYPLQIISFLLKSQSKDSGEYDSLNVSLLTFYVQSECYPYEYWNVFFASIFTAE